MWSQEHHGLSVGRLAAWDYGFAVMLSVLRVGVWCHYRKEILHSLQVGNVIPPSQTKLGRKFWVSRNEIGSVRKWCFPLLRLSIPLTVHPSRHTVYRHMWQACQSKMSMAWALLPKSPSCNPVCWGVGNCLTYGLTYVPVKDHIGKLWTDCLPTSTSEATRIPGLAKRCHFFTDGLWFIFKQIHHFS